MENLKLAGKNLVEELEEAKKIAAFFGIPESESNEAAANVIQKFYGIDLLDLFSMSNKVDNYSVTIADIKMRLGLSTISDAQKLLADYGFQKDVPGKKGKTKWRITDKGLKYGKIEYNGTKQRRLWKESIFDALEKETRF